MAAKKIQQTDTARPKFKFSFVMPIYNVEKYVDETIQSILDQTMDFKENCEIIFVNDGSSDGSEKICKQYQERFPANIKYIKQKNMGVSAARNKGIELAEGKYISFLDSDDKLSTDTLEEVYNFIEENYEEVDMVAIKLEFFDSKNGPHVLNWKFSETKVIDLEKQPEYVQLSSSSTFIKNEVIQGGGHRFDTNVRYSEDSKFISEILLTKLKIGVLAEPAYYYRRRQDNNSAINSSYSNKDWYMVTPKRVYEYLFDLSRKRYSYVPKYIQHLVMYDLQWRFLQEQQGVLTDDEETEYKQSLFGLIKHIDAEIILFQKNIYTEHKIYLVKNKFNITDAKKIKSNGAAYFINEVEVYNYEKNNQDFVLSVTETGEHNILLLGTLRGYLFPGVAFGCVINGEFYPAAKIDFGPNPTKFLGEKLYDENNFKLNIRLNHGHKVGLALKLVDGTIKPINITPGRHSKLAPFNGWAYFGTNNYTVRHAKRDILFVSRKGKKGIVKDELGYIAALFLKRQLGIKTALKITGLRVAFYTIKPFVKKRIWLISDRPKMAGDNGEAFFKYVTNQKNGYYKPYFVLSKESPDFAKLSKIGRVIDQQSIRYKILFLLSDRVISSAADDIVINPYKDGILERVSDLPRFEFVFLQHGVIHNDLSDWLNKLKKNIGTFVTTSKLEYDSILQGGYGYGRRELALTGQPRHDYLKDVSTGRTIVIMPTWRHSIAGVFDKSAMTRQRSNSFKDAEYYKQWQALIDDEVLNKKLESIGVKIEFYLHPALHSNIGDFKGTKNVKIMQPPFNYGDALSRASLLITDYSSVAFDFAYLRKPILYFQFDYDDFYNNHMFKPGYYKYKSDAFGKVVHDRRSLIKEIIEIQDKAYKLDAGTSTKIETFFKWNDKHNSQRLYQGLLSKDQDDYCKFSSKKSLRFLGKRLRNRTTKPIKLFWWRYEPPYILNFGDEITGYILRGIWGRSVEWAPKKDADLIATGSILDSTLTEERDKPLYVWGSGLIRDGEGYSGKDLRIFAVRGPITRDRVAPGANIALGDPGLLSNLVFSSSKKRTYRIGIVAHYIDLNLPSIAEISKRSDVLLISPLQTPDKVAKDITSCRIVVSSSLHGLIFADSFSIPNYWMPLSDKLAGGDYKFKDYYESTGRVLNKVTINMLEDADEVARLISTYEPIPNLKKLQKDLIEAFPFADGTNIPMNANNVLESKK